MLNTLRCRLKGHLYVDSRSMPGMQTCVRCRHREPFEGALPETDPTHPAAGASGRPREG